VNPALIAIGHQVEYSSGFDHAAGCDLRVYRWACGGAEDDYWAAAKGVSTQAWLGLADRCCNNPADCPGILLGHAWSDGVTVRLIDD